MKNVKIDKDGIEFNYESKYKCPVCGSQDRAFKMSTDMTLYGSNDDNVRYETCSCEAVLQIKTTVTIMEE